MADKVQGVTKGATDAAGNAGGATDKLGGIAGNAQGYIEGATEGLLASITGWGNWVAMKGKELLDRFIPPEKRAAFLQKLQDFMLANPKLSSFLGMNLALTGVPLFLFIAFSITVFIFSLIVGLLVGLVGALLFTLTMVGIALSVVFPLIFFTTLTATFLFLWGLGGYYILKWANGDAKNQKAPEGQSVGDKLNAFTGGRLTGFMNAARNKESKGDISGFGDKHTPPQGEQNDKPKAEQNGKPKGGHKDSSDKENHPPQKQQGGAEKKTNSMSNAASNAPDVRGVSKKVTDSTPLKGGVNTATNAIGV